MDNLPSVPEVRSSLHQLDSGWLNRIAEMEFFYPPNFSADGKINLLLLNDGQDIAGLKLEESLSVLYADQKIEPLLVVAIKASIDRLQEYGVTGVPDYKGRGAQAGNYNAFIIDELLPFIHKETGVQTFEKIAFAGCSLGGLSAFDIAWNNPGVFDFTGVFSGSFWWRTKDLNDGYTDGDRILHQMIRNSDHVPALKFWLMAGTEDELADRNHNYIIDAIDDTIDVIKELVKKGYKRPEDMFYYEFVGGQHNVASWAIVLPSFLTWAFGKKSY